MVKHCCRAALLAALFILVPGIGQAATPGPDSLSAAALPLALVDTVRYPALDLARIAEEDALRQSEGAPARFAIPHEVALDIHAAGTWEEAGGRSIWRYRVMAEQAVSLNFGFTHYRLPPSAQLFIYDSEHRQLAGPWGAEKNQPQGQLWTPAIVAADVVIELDVDTAERGQVELLLGRINQGYRAIGGRAAGYAQPDLGQAKRDAGTCSDNEINSGTCNMDVACLGDDDPWNDPRRAVGAITVYGSDYCSGSLVNTTANDRRRLFATATHCDLTSSSAPSVVIYWNYEWPTCRTPGTSASGQVGPFDPNMSSSGVTFVAATPDPFSAGSCQSGMEPTCTDWTLVEVNDPFDPAWNLYWEGWDRRTAGAACSQPSDPTSTDGLCASIHHPGVDEKRITFVATPLTTSGIAAGTNTHWHAAWTTSPPILPNIPGSPSSLPPGVTEGGSSGSPLYTPEQRIVGVLSGGSSSCGATGSNLSDDYGQLAIAWEGRGTPATRMKDHLDPLNTGAEFIDGMGMSPFTLSLDPATLSVCTASTGGASTTVEVSADGGFSGSVALAVDDLPAGANAAFTPTSVVPPGSSSLELGNLGAVATGHYAVKVMGSSGADSTFRVLDLMLSDALPQAVGLLSPADGQTGASTSPILAWSAANGGPADYRVEVATDAAFSTTVFSRTLVNQTSVTVEPALAPLTTFYWRVRADNACGTGDWSQVRSFTTGVTFPEPYCSVSFPSDVEPITRVKFSGIDNRSCAAVNCGPALEDFLAIPGGAIEPGQSYEMRVEGNTAGNYTTRVKAFFDWNRNGSFEAGEGYTIGSIVNSTGEDNKFASATINVPASLTPGPVRMRVTKKYSTEADACNTSGYGQAEDYWLDYPFEEAIFGDGFEH